MLYSFPTAGDAVVLVGQGVDKLGSIGILGGRVGCAADEFLLTFSASAFSDGEIVSCSGGPAPYVSSGDLVPTGETVVRNFWRWKDGISGAGRGEAYSQEVALWQWNPSTSRQKIENALETYRFWDEAGALYMPNARRACHVLGYPKVKRPRPPREVLAERFDPGVPDKLKAAVLDLCDRSDITGLSDLMYISNVIAKETGSGDGSGVFWGNVVDIKDARRAAERLYGSYRSCFFEAAIALSDVESAVLAAVQ